MGITIVDIDVPNGLTRYKNTATNATKAAVKASSGTIWAIVVDNTANAAVTFVKLWNVASGSVTVGTTAPDFCFQIPASTKTTLTFVEGISFDTALTEASVTTAGTAGVTGPSSNVPLTIIYT